MMSAPDRVDIDIPNTEEAKMVSVKSTENLRNLLSPAHQQEHQQRQQQRQHVLEQTMQQPSKPNNRHQHHVEVNLDQDRAAVQAAQHQGSPRSHSSAKSMPPISSSQRQTKHEHQHQDQESNFVPEYTAWTIGSTEALLRSMAIQNHPVVHHGATSPYNSKILAKCSSDMIWREPSPDMTSASESSTIPMSAASSVSGTSPPPPPPSPAMPPTLGGLSQNVAMDNFGNKMTGAENMAALHGGHPLLWQHPGHQHRNFRQIQRNNSLPGPPPRNFYTPPPPYSTPEQITPTTPAQANQAAVVGHQYDKSLQELYHTRLLSTPAPAVESLLSSSCESLNFDIAEMWLRTGPKTHQLTNSHVRATALDESVRKQLVDVYYGERSAERTHRLSPALCKRAKEAGDVVWVTAHTAHGAEALKCSISDVRTAVAVPVCHGGSGTNVTIIYFSIRRSIMKPQAVEFLVHMSLATVVAAVNALAEESMVDEITNLTLEESVGEHGKLGYPALSQKMSQSVHLLTPHNKPLAVSRDGPHCILSVTGAQLNLEWDALRNVEYLTDGGNNWIHTAVLNGKSVVVKTLKPECQDVALAINEIESELEVHSRLDHPNVVKLIGAGFTPRGVRFMVMERLDGGTLTQLLGYDNRIRDRRRRFWTKRKISYMDVLKCARSLAEALAYLHGKAIPNVMVLHRDLKPDNIGFALDGTVKLFDFGLARIVENASVSNEVYQMSGETGSLRYMAPEVADSQPYNQKADVYSFGVILWELVAFKKPYEGMNREEFYSRVVRGGERPVINKKWPEDLTELMKSCWDAEINQRPNFADIVDVLDSMVTGEKDGNSKKKRPKNKNKFVSSLIERHSTWF